MEPLSRIRSVLRNLLRKQDVESQLDAELRAYVDIAADDKTAAGMPSQEARRIALAEAGGIEQLKQSVRDRRSGISIELLWQDVRYGLRQLRRNPAFTLTVVITLGLGIGATTAIFSAVYALLLRPLPYHDARRLMFVSAITRDDPSVALQSADFVAARQATKSFAPLAAYYNTIGNLTGGQEPLRVTRAGVTWDFLSMLGVPPQLGRSFTASDDHAGAPPVILLSDRLWRSQFHADRAVLGKAVNLGGDLSSKPLTIIGVLPPHFSFPDPALEPDVYTPAALPPDTVLAVDKPSYRMQVIGRLRDGVTPEQAQTELLAFFQAHAHVYPAVIAALFSDRKFGVEPLQRHLTGDDRKPLAILLVSVIAVLLIACANVANLQLARAVVRQHETALRSALGASRARLIRQFLVESLLLASLSAALGLVIAIAVTSAVRHFGEQQLSAFHAHAAQHLSLPFGKLSVAVHVDGWVVAFTIALALATTLLFGLAPALEGVRTDLRHALQTAGLRITSGREQRLLRHTLLIAEIGLAVVLLTSAGLLVRSFVNVLRYESGFDPANTLTASTLLTDQQHRSPFSRLNFADSLLPRLQALPGVKAAALASALPLAGVDGTSIAFEGAPIPPPELRKGAPIISITPDYFHAVGTPLLRGRAFDTTDTPTSIRVAIVNREFAARYFAGDAVGKRFKMWDGPYTQPPITIAIVGIAENVRHNGLEQQVQPEFFVPEAQQPSDFLNIVLRTETDPAQLANSVRYAVLDVDRHQPVFNIQTMGQRVADIVAQRKLIMLLTASFAMLAVVLSAVGVYGVFTYSMSQRAHEMGIRLALGSSRAGLIRLVVLQAARLVALGGTLGLIAAFLLSKLLSSQLVGITPHDAVSFTLAWTLMTAIAILASTIPAANAARTNLLSVLHAE